MEVQALNLDAGTVLDPSPEDVIAPAGADIQLAYNADRAPHAVVFPVGESVEMSFVAGVGFDGISSSDTPNLVFSSEPTDLPFSDNDCVVIRTDQGAVFKLGNAVETGLSVTFNYAALWGGEHHDQQTKKILLPGAHWRATLDPGTAGLGINLH